MSHESSRYQDVQTWLENAPAVGPFDVDSVAALLHGADNQDLELLCEFVLDRFEQFELQPTRLRSLLQLIASQLVTRRSQTLTGAPEDLVEEPWTSPTISVETLLQLYDRVSEVDAHCAAHILQCLAAQPVEETMSALAKCLTESPPDNWQLLGIGLSPLWRESGEILEYFFGILEDALLHPATMPVLLDLANHAVRSGRLNAHPWAAKQPMLAELLNQMVIRLEKLQRDPKHYGDSVTEVQRILGDSVALTVSLCDTLGLIGRPEAIPTLVEAGELAHRRIQTEAAAALVRLGDQSGKKRLIELAADIIARRRAVEYAEELSVADEIDEQFRLPTSLAESTLAVWLASPEHFGVPPTSIQFVESRTLYWPGYEEPRDCFLFRYGYELPQGSSVNIGIVGPVTLAFSCNLSSLPIEDAYAAFAGWQLEHEEIFELPIGQLNASQSRQAERLVEVIRQLDYEVVSSIALTFMLGIPALMVRVTANAVPGIAIAHDDEVAFFPTSGQPDGMTPEIALSIYRGRKLLAAFNSIQ